MDRVTRRRLLEHALEDDARADLARFALGLGVPPDRAPHVADAAVVRVFRGPVPRDLRMVDTLLRLEVRRIVAGTTSAGSVGVPAVEPAAVPSRRVLGRRVRRARAGRVGLVAGGALVACGLVAGGALAVTQVDRTPAASGSEVGVDRPPAVVAEPTTPATPRVLGTVTEGPGLPAAQPLLEGMLEAAGPGWSLVQFEAREIDDATFVYLMGPDGTLYEVPTAIGARSWFLDPWVLDWLEGTSLVIANGAWSGDAEVVDLLTGRRLLTVPSRLEGHPEAMRSIAFVGDGTTDLVASWTWSGVDGVLTEHVVRLGLDGVERAVAELPLARGAGYEAPLLSDDGERLVLNDAAGPRIVASTDFRELTAVPAPDPADAAACAAVRWLGEDALLLRCVLDDASTTELWLGPLSGEGPVRLAEGYGVTALAVGDGLVLGRAGELASSAPDDRRQGAALYQCGWDGRCSDEPLAEVPGWLLSDEAAGTLYTYDAPLEGPWFGGAARAVDLATGEVRTLLEAGPDGSIRAVLPAGATSGASDWASQ